MVAKRVPILLGQVLRSAIAVVWIATFVLLALSWSEGYSVRYSRSRLVLGNGPETRVYDKVVDRLPSAVQESERLSNFILGFKAKHGRCMIYWHYRVVYPAVANLRIENYIDFSRSLLVVSEFESGDVLAPQISTFRGWPRFSIGSFRDGFADNDFICFPLAVALLLASPFSVMLVSDLFARGHKREDGRVE
jgi:hypothetical protein